MSSSPVDIMSATPVVSAVDTISTCPIDSPVKTFTEPATRVFWDVVDFPFPDGVDPALIYQRLKRIPEEMGFRGGFSVMAYVDEETFPDELIDEYENAGIAIIYHRHQQGDRYGRADSMLVDIVSWALENPANYFEPLNLMVISKNVKKETDFFDALEALEDRFFNVLLALPQDLSSSSSSELHTVSFDWLLTSLLDQSGTLQDLNHKWNHKGKSREETVGFSDGLASLYPQEFGWSQITVFWDVQDCVMKIGSALREKGYEGEVLIRPYVDGDFQGQWVPESDCPGMHVDTLTRVVTKGNKYAKITKMLLDLLFWAMNSDDIPQNFMLISKPHTMCNIVIKALEHRGFNLILGPSDEVSLQLLNTVPDGERLIRQSVKLQGRKLREGQEHRRSSPFVVCWLLEEDYPSNPALMQRNIMSTIEKKGYQGTLSFTVYVEEGKFPNGLKEVYNKLGIIVKFTHKGYGRAKVDKMLWDMIMWTFTSAHASDFLVIAKPFQDWTLDCLLEEFEYRGLNVLFELPDYMVTFGSSVWSAKSLLRGSCSAPIGEANSSGQ